MSPSLSPHLSSFPLPKRESWLVPVAKGFSFVLSRRFQLIFIVCLLGQSSVIFDETPLRTVPLLFIIVVSRGTPSLPPRGRVNFLLRDESARPIGISPLYFGDETHGYKDLSFHLYFPFARERSVVRDISTFNEEARLHEEALSNIVHHDFAMIPSSLLHGKPTFYTRTCVCRDLCTPLARYTRLVK